MHVNTEGYSEISQTPGMRVAIVYRKMPHYRRRFFELLRQRLAEQAITLQLIYGQPAPTDAVKKDIVELEWAHHIENRIMSLGRVELYWQPCLRLVDRTDLVIVEQASKLLVNYFLQTRYLLGGPKFAFWGHGKNFSLEEHSYVGEFLKRNLSKRAHWWFAYNERSAAVVRSFGFPTSRITLTQNAIDTRSLIAAARAVEPCKLESIRHELSLKGENVCIFAGGMYGEKRLPFLLEACEVVRQRVPDFEVIFVGAGTAAALIQQAAARHSWIKYVGPKFDDDKVPYFLLSKLSLMPGLVGLGVLDAFALGVPLVTTAVPYHSPEIEYLQNGLNGVVVRQTESVTAYAETVTELLRDEGKRQLLVAGGRASAEVYTIENMVDRFAEGVRRALAA
jgi:glycosyltransferase involved in cell wall biosynthesis